MKTLAIDYGESRIGLAISDELGLVAAALDIVRNSSKSKALGEIATFIRKENVAKIVFGLPFFNNNEESSEIKIMKNFAFDLAQTTKTSLEFWDESFSSQQAEKGARGRKKAQADSEAARIILQEYLDNQARGGSNFSI